MPPINGPVMSRRYGQIGGMVRVARYPLLDVRFGRELNSSVLARASTDQPPQTHISEESMPDIRKETDDLGVVEVPADSAQIQRSVELTARRTVEK